MKRTMFFLLVVVGLLGLVLGACKKEGPKAEPDKKEEPKAEPDKKEEPTAEPDKKEEPKEEPKAEPTKGEPDKKEEAAGGGDAEQNCGDLYDTMKKFIAAMEKKFGKGKNKKEFPPREKFINGCKELPAKVVRCMNPKTAMAEGKKCAEVMKKVDPAKIAKFKSMMK